MDIFLIFLLALIGVAALVGIILAVKILEFIHKNRESTIGEIEPRLKTLLMHFFLVITYFTIICLVYMIAYVFMK